MAEISSRTSKKNKKFDVLFPWSPRKSSAASLSGGQATLTSQDSPVKGPETRFEAALEPCFDSQIMKAQGHVVQSGAESCFESQIGKGWVHLLRELHRTLTYHPNHKKPGYTCYKAVPNRVSQIIKARGHLFRSCTEPCLVSQIIEGEQLRTGGLRNFKHARRLFPLTTQNNVIQNLLLCVGPSVLRPRYFRA